jgi:hypothetical protein
MRKNTKLFTKRLRFTKRRKVLRRKIQQGHFKAKEDGNIRRGKRKIKEELSTVIMSALKKNKHITN